MMNKIEQKDIDRLNFTIKNSNITEMNNLYHNVKTIDFIESIFNKNGQIIVDDDGYIFFKINWVFKLKIDTNLQQTPVPRPTHYEKSFILLLINSIKEMYDVDDYILTYDFLVEHVDAAYNNKMSGNVTINNYYLNITNKEINIDKRQTKSVTYSDGCNYRNSRLARNNAYINGMKLPKPANLKAYGYGALSMW